MNHPKTSDAASSSLVTHSAVDRRQTRGAFVSWLNYHGRSQGFVDRLGLTPIYVSYLRQQDIISAPVKYGPQFISTLRRLYRVKPEVVFVMDPPVFAVAAVFLYCLHTRARYLMDCHSGVFNSPKWRWSLPIQRFFGRCAAGVIVTNPVHLNEVVSWPAKGILVGDPPPTLPAATVRSAEPTAPYVFVIGVFGEDEDVPKVLEAAARLPGVRFRISGDTKRARRAWLENHPSNVAFTGFLSTNDFWSHVRDASAILTLTTREDTILRGGWEAMFMEQPLITSGTSALRRYFTRGTVFVDHSPDAIAAGVKYALSHQEELRVEAKALREEKYTTWCQERTELARLAGMQIAGGEQPSGPST
jgi:glycosyltransferase involved in cell wall biosynthesis